jgi:hypothetical protein
MVLRPLSAVSEKSYLLYKSSAFNEFCIKKTLFSLFCYIKLVEIPKRNRTKRNVASESKCCVSRKRCFFRKNLIYTEAEFLDAIGKKVFLLANIHSHLY